MKVTIFMLTHALVSAILLNMCVAAQASEKKSPFSGGVSIASEYDSNVAVSEVDASVNAGDAASTVDFDLDFDATLSQRTDLSLGYSFSDSRYQQYSAFDLQSHFASAGLTYDFGKQDLGLAYRYIETKLDGEDFLTLQQVSPFFSKLLGKKFYLRADYTHSNKRFAGRPGRDAIAQSVGLDMYWFIKGNSRYVVVGYKFDVDDSLSPEFDFQAHNLKARFIQRINVGSRALKFKLGWRYETRSYESVTPSIAAVRDDERHRFESELEIPLVANVYAKLSYEYADFTSNLAAVNFDRQVVSAQLGANF